MSKIGKIPIEIPRQVKIDVKGNTIFFEGPKGKLMFTLPPEIILEINKNRILVKRDTDSRKDKVSHGLARSLINNMVKGVTDGYTKELEIIGVGFRAQVQGKQINLQLGYSHPIIYHIPEGVTIETPSPTRILIRGIDKSKVGQVSAEIRSFYSPEPYKGKGIRYRGEYVRHKAGKAVA